MAENKLNLDVNTILEKEFHVDFKGYSSNEVDTLLDKVIEDYQNFEQVLDELTQVNLNHERTIAALKAKIVELESHAKIVDNKNSLNSNQMDMLKRLARLEDVVYSKID